MYIFLFYHLPFVSFKVYVKYFFDVLRNQTSNKKYLLELMKRRKKFYKSFISRDRTLHFDQ